MKRLLIILTLALLLPFMSEAMEAVLLKRLNDVNLLLKRKNRPDVTEKLLAEQANLQVQLGIEPGEGKEPAPVRRPAPAPKVTKPSVGEPTVKTRTQPKKIVTPAPGKSIVDLAREIGNLRVDVMDAAAALEKARTPISPLEQQALDENIDQALL